MDAMPFRTYLRYCVLGSLAWVFICVLAGFLLGNVPWVSQHFEHVVLGIIILSVLAIVKEVVKDRRERRAHATATASVE
jgi:membrane-associated protein